jgi:hypothetical protein
VTLGDNFGDFPVAMSFAMLDSLYGAVGPALVASTLNPPKSRGI